MKLTELEQKFMTAVPKDDFYEQGFESVLWSDVFFDAAEIDPKVGRGVLSSLIQKGFIEGGVDAFSLDEKGVEWMKANFELDEEGYEI